MQQRSFESILSQCPQNSEQDIRHLISVYDLDIGQSEDVCSWALPEPAKIKIISYCSHKPFSSKIVPDPISHHQLGFFMLWPFSLISKLLCDLRLSLSPLMGGLASDPASPNETSRVRSPGKGVWNAAYQRKAEQKPWLGCGEEQLSQTGLGCWWTEVWCRSRAASAGSVRPESDPYQKSALQPQGGS